MFKCGRCEALEDEVKHLREMNTKLLGTVTALQSPHAFHLINQPPVNNEDGFYGDGRDQYITHGQFGEQVLVEKEMNVEGV